MASAIPYDPDDFENNNPFAEPEDNAPSPNPPLQYLTPHQHPQYHQQYQQTQTQTQYDQSQAHFQAQGTNGANDGTGNVAESHVDPEQLTDLLTKKELLKLLPERFQKKYLLKITLESIEKNRPTNPIIRFSAEVQGLPRYRQSTYKDIRRTYSEVVKFNQYLTISNLEVFVPVIPLPQTSYPTGGEDETKHLLYLWQEWFDRIARNPILITDEELVYFIESDFGYSVINSKRRSAVASGFMRKTLKQLSVPYDPFLDLAEFRPMVKSSYLLCQKIHKIMEQSQKCDRLLSALVSELSTKLRGLAQFEQVHPGMKNMWEKFSKVAQTQAELTLVQLVTDMVSIGDGVEALANDLFEVKEALTNRHLIMREYLQAQAQTKAKQIHAAKLKSRSSLDPIKVDEAINSLEMSTMAEENLLRQVKRISGEMRFERKEEINFIEKKFHHLLKSFTLNRVDHHRKLLKHLESIRLDVRIIDAKGGLSRLNRDNLTQMKHNLSQSQAEGGDSWSSRTFRSLAVEEAEKEDRIKKRDESIPIKVDAEQAASLLGVATF
ncbi:hypothetical protein PUMCH_002304 [Australozyma saopauloensis]|uniref:Vacuolar protein sorting-associated protein 17 n=1 Tax=Australozyma saopauloensis TaxID=291208 RepID=A0AAX4HB66_9ASCO|nr:hypothetical protein PUMCH_002304 [[Candida] saopauloensis]